jgi:hypothetical protein
MEIVRIAGVSIKGKETIAMARGSSTSRGDGSKDAPLNPVDWHDPEGWKDPAWPLAGDPDQREVWTAVGEALSAWGIFEADLGQLFQHFITLDRSSASAERAFGSILSFEGRRSLLQGAGEAYFAYHPEDHQEHDLFRDILKESQKAARVRNNIAHGVVTPYLPPNGAAVDGYCLLPSHCNSKRRSEFHAPEFVYNADSIKRFAVQFAHLCEAPTKLAGVVVMRARAAHHRFRPLPPD